MDDDDRHWLTGTIYINREDKRILVPKKLGLGLGRTLNLAHPASWLVLLAPLVVAILLTLTHQQ